MLTSRSELLTPPTLSIASVLMRPPRGGELDAPALRDAEVAALADDAAAQLRAVDAHRVVGLVADVGVRLGRGLHVGADAAVQEQVDRRLQQRADHLVGGQPSALDRRAPRGPAATAGSPSRGESGRRRRPRSAPRRSRSRPSSAARTGGRAPRSSPPASGLGSRKTWRWLNAPTSRMWGEQQHPVAEHVPRHVADADDREIASSGCPCPARGSGA